nr:KxYKxGKxW signal peptide domain-containing protein [Lacticaseibacillus saniviri]
MAQYGATSQSKEHFKQYKSGQFWATSMMTLALVASGLSFATASANNVHADTTTSTSTQDWGPVKTKIGFYMKSIHPNTMIGEPVYVTGIQTSLIDAEQLKPLLPPGYALDGEVTQRYGQMLVWIPVIPVPVTNKVNYEDVASGEIVGTGKDISGTYDTAVTPNDAPDDYTIVPGQSFKLGPDGTVLTVEVQKIIAQVTNKINYVDATSGKVIAAGKDVTGKPGDSVVPDDIPIGYKVVPNQVLTVGADGTTISVQLVPATVTNKVVYVDNKGTLIQAGKDVTGKFGDAVTPADVPAGYELVPGQTLHLGTNDSTLKITVKKTTPSNPGNGNNGGNTGNGVDTGDGGSTGDLPSTGGNNNNISNPTHNDKPSNPNDGSDSSQLGNPLHGLVATVATDNNGSNALIYDRPGSQQLVTGSAWKAYRVYTDNNGTVWYNLGGNQWIKAAAVILDAKAVHNTPLNTVGTVVRGAGVPVYTKPGIGGQTTGEVLKVGSAWKISSTLVTSDGQVWYHVGANQWIKATDITLGNVQPIHGVATINYVKGYGINVWNNPQGTRFNGKRLTTGSAWRVFAKTTGANGHVFYNVGGNQWIDSAYVNFKHIN